MKEVEVKLSSDRENRLLTGKTYSCYVEADAGDRREVTISGQKMFHNFSSSADPTEQSGKFLPKNFAITIIVLQQKCTTWKSDINVL